MTAPDPTQTPPPSDLRSVMSLSPGQAGDVVSVGASGAVRQRLLDMGLIPGVRVRVERVAPSGEPVWIRIRGAQLALRRTEAESIFVEM